MRPTETQLAEAVARLRAGELVAFPTETVYGLGGDAANADAVRRIFELKGRPATHPVIVHLPDASHLRHWAADVPPAAARLAQRFWPGPLTLILRKAPQVHAAVTGGQDSVGLRVPAHPVARALLGAFGGGIAAPSANRYGHLSPTTAAHVRAEFGADAPLILDGGACEVGIESTIVDARTPALRVLRPGMLGVAALEAAVQDLPGASVVVGAGVDAPRVPGSTAAHYAPRVPLHLCAPGALSSAVARQLSAQSGPVAVLALGPATENFATASAAGRLQWVSLGRDPVHYAHELYAALHQLEDRAVSVILAEEPPLEADWQAVRDRLRRAAHEFR